MKKIDGLESFCLALINSFAEILLFDPPCCYYKGCLKEERCSYYRYTNPCLEQCFKRDKKIFLNDGFYWCFYLVGKENLYEIFKKIYKKYSSLTEFRKSFFNKYKRYFISYNKKRKNYFRGEKSKKKKKEMYNYVVYDENKKELARGDTFVAVAKELGKSVGFIRSLYFGKSSSCKKYSVEIEEIK